MDGRPSYAEVKDDQNRKGSRLNIITHAGVVYMTWIKN